MRSTYISVGILFCSILLLMVPATPLLAGTACGKTKAASETEDNQIIRDAQGLTQAVNTATGGETILLAGGNYGALIVKKGFKTPVTIPVG